MVTRRRAPGMGSREPSVHASAVATGPMAPHNVPAHQVHGSNDLTRQVAHALNANLDRGFLESEGRFRQIADTLHDIVFLTSADLGAIHFINAAYEEIWGRSRAELLENPMAFLEGVHPGDRERVLDALTRRPANGYDIEFRVVRPTGEVRWVWSRGFPVRDATGEINRIAGIAEDTTDRKRIVASHEQLIRGFTHDVKNPLGAADGYLALLQDGVLGDLSQPQAESIARARRSIRTALDLIVQLLDIERAQTGTLDLHRESFDLGAAISDLVEESRAGASAKQLTLSLELSSDAASPLVIYSDPTRVRQIIANLLSNAVKYTQAGGRCTVRARFMHETDASSPARWIAVSVADNGPGIPIEKQHLLFREFTRLDPGAADGSGIGLAITQRLALALEGSITFESMPGVGTTFTLRLPMDRRAPPPEYHG